MSPADASRSTGGDRAETSLIATIERVTYHDESSLYTVLRVSLDEGYAPTEGSLFATRRVTAVGRTNAATEGARVRLAGRWGRHPSHGPQFEFAYLEPLPPVGDEGLVRYLASKHFSGIGEKLARRIVSALGTDTLDVIRDSPERLHAIRGLRPEVAARLAEAVRAQSAAHRTGAFLRGLGLGPIRSAAVVKRLGVACEDTIRDNPYALAGVPGLGFATADQIARKLEVTPDDQRRLAAALLHVLQESASEGHSFVRRGSWVGAATELLSATFDVDTFERSIEQLVADDEIVLDTSLAESQEVDDETPVYLPWLAASERALARNLERLLTHAEVASLAQPEKLRDAETRARIELHPVQREAIQKLLATSVGLLTGGPGVGKTTIVRFVVELAEANGLRVLLASPTGRAAKRLAEATGRKASTVHRLLGYSPDGGFEHDDKHAIKAGLVIVDEISMLDVVLAHHLVKAIQPPTRLLFVGDPDQLPSVGPGNVLRDLIDSQCITVCRLTQIFRQSRDSLIVSNAHRILEGQMPELPEAGDLSSDFYFFSAEDAEATRELTVDVITRRIPQTFNVAWTDDVQVIAPMYRGECGVDMLNERLRDAQGVGGREVFRGNERWRVGDRVIHTRNDYERQVFNGDMGRITHVTSDGMLSVRYPEQDVIYKGAEIGDLRPAFAITVHRSQGGEFPVVVIPMVTQHFMMLQRNLLYTAITRAQRLVVLVGSRRALQMAVDNDRQDQRESALGMRLRALIEHDSDDRS